MDEKICGCFANFRIKVHIPRCIIFRGQSGAIRGKSGSKSSERIVTVEWVGGLVVSKAAVYIRSEVAVENVIHQSILSVCRSKFPDATMHPASVAIFALVCCYILPCITAGQQDNLSLQEDRSPFLDRSLAIEAEGNEGLNRQKRTLLLKKKLIGAGLLGFGLGVAKGYKAAYYTAPQVHHVYLSPPPPSVKYVEYVEKPIFVERIIEKPLSSYGSSW